MSATVCNTCIILFEILTSFVYNGIEIHLSICMNLFYTYFFYIELSLLNLEMNIVILVTVVHPSKGKYIKISNF